MSIVILYGTESGNAELVAGDLADAMPDTDAGRAAGVLVMEAMWSRYLPQSDLVRQVIAEGIIGDVRHVTADFGFVVPFDAGHRMWNAELGGGALLGFIDVALFAAARGFGLITAGTAVTLDLNTQFIGGGRIGAPIEAQVEVLKETGRLLFLRGLVVQGDDEAKIAAFSATIRKPSPKPPKG